MTVFPEPPAALHEREIWICWRMETRGDADKPTKVPIDPETGRKPDPTAEETGTTFENAVACHENDGVETEGIGFIFPEDDTIAGIDIDDGRDKETGEPKYQWVRDALDTADTYTEVSPSGGGYHAILFGFKPGERCRTGAGLPDDSEVEMYDKDRFFTYTGEHVEGTPTDVQQRHQELGELYEWFFGDGDDSGTDDESNSDVSDESGGNGGGGNDEDDDDILEKARAAKNGEKFAQLYDRGSTSGYESHSEARQALVNLLAFWTNGDETRMRNLFEDSALAKEKPEKSMRDFDNYAADKALKKVSDGYDPTDHGNSDGKPEKLSSFDAPTTDGGDSDEDEDDDADSWSYIRERYLSTDTGSTNQANYYAAELLADTLGVITDDVSTAMYWYNPDRGFHQDRASHRIQERLVSPHGLGTTFSPNRADNVVKTVQAKTYTKTNDLGGDRHILAVGNGTLEWDRNGDPDATGTPTLREHRKDDYLLSGLGVEYDPDADCPRFQKFINQVVPDSDDRKALQEYVGYCLVVNELPVHRALMLVGGGANGKGQFLTIVEELLGDENVSNQALQSIAEEENARADIYRKLANIHNDLSEAALGKGNVFKAITGDDTLTARWLYQNSFKFHPTAKHLYAANKVPDVKTDDDGFFRRWLVIEFPTHIPREERTQQLGEKIAAEELPGILNWALEGRSRVLTNNAFTAEGDAAEKRAEWMQWGNSVKQFVSKCLEHVDDDDQRMTAAEVYERYQQFVALELEGETPEQQRTVTKEVQNIPGVLYSTKYRFDGKQKNGFKRLELTDEFYQLLAANAGQDSQQETDDRSTEHDGTLPTAADGGDGEQHQAALRGFLIDGADALDNSHKGAVKEQLLDYAERGGYDRERAEHQLQKLLESGTLYHSGSSDGYVRLNR